jgi:hypothetical protein
LTLALAIGANVSIFAVVQRVVLNPLGYPDPDRLIAVDLGWPSPNIPSGLSSIPSRLFFQYADHARTLDGVAVYRPEDLTLTGQGIPERIRVARTTPSLAPVLRVSPALGRWFTGDEGEPGASQGLAGGDWADHHHPGAHRHERFVTVSYTLKPCKLG